MVHILPVMLLLGFFRNLREALKDPKYQVRFLWVFITLLVGVIFYSLVEGWSLLDAFYFSVITLTTVGYGDFSPTSSISKIFTVFYIFSGLSILLAFIELMTSHRLRKAETRAKRRIDQTALADNDLNVDQDEGQISPIDLDDEAVENGGLSPAIPLYLAELRQLAMLKDQGIVTQKEFEAKKKQLLGL